MARMLSLFIFGRLSFNCHGVETLWIPDIWITTGLLVLQVLAGLKDKQF